MTESMWDEATEPIQAHAGRLEQTLALDAAAGFAPYLSAATSEADYQSRYMTVEGSLIAKVGAHLTEAQTVLYEGWKAADATRAAARLAASMKTSADDIDSHMYDWGYSKGQEARNGNPNKHLDQEIWSNEGGLGGPIDWKNSDAAFPRGYRDGLAGNPKTAGSLRDFMNEDLGSGTCKHCGKAITNRGGIWMDNAKEQGADICLDNKGTTKQYGGEHVPSKKKTSSHDDPPEEHQCELGPDGVCTDCGTPMWDPKEASSDFKVKGPASAKAPGKCSLCGDETRPRRVPADIDEEKNTLTYANEYFCHNCGNVEDSRYPKKGSLDVEALLAASDEKDFVLAHIESEAGFMDFLRGPAPEPHTKSPAEVRRDRLWDLAMHHNDADALDDLADHDPDPRMLDHYEHKFRVAVSRELPEPPEPMAQNEPLTPDRQPVQQTTPDVHTPRHGNFFHQKTPEAPDPQRAKVDKEIGRLDHVRDQERDDRRSTEKSHDDYWKAHPDEHARFLQNNASVVALAEGLGVEAVNESGFGAGRYLSDVGYDLGKPKAEHAIQEKNQADTNKYPELDKDKQSDYPTFPKPEKDQKPTGINPFTEKRVTGSKTAEFGNEPGQVERPSPIQDSEPAQPRTTRPRVHPTPRPNPTFVEPPTQPQPDVAPPVVRAPEGVDYSSPSFEQQVAAKLARVARTVAENNPHLTMQAARGIATMAISRHPGILGSKIAE